MTLRRKHTCQVRKTSSTLSQMCGKPAEEQRSDVRLWVCPEHQYFMPDLNRQPTPIGVWPANRRWYRITHRGVTQHAEHAAGLPWGWLP